MRPFVTFTAENREVHTAGRGGGFKRVEGNGGEEEEEEQEEGDGSGGGGGREEGAVFHLINNTNQIILCSTAP